MPFMFSEFLFAFQVAHTHIHHMSFISGKVPVFKRKKSGLYNNNNKKKMKTAFNEVISRFVDVVFIN